MTVLGSVSDLAEHVGQELGVGPWNVIDQDLVNRFAELSGDRYWIHVDADRARRDAPFSSTIAHGMLTLSLVPQLEIGFDGLEIRPLCRFAVNYGLDRVRFPHPVKVGSRIRLRVQLVRVSEPALGQVDVVRGNLIEIEGVEKPAVVAEQITRYFL